MGRKKKTQTKLLNKPTSNFKYKTLYLNSFIKAYGMILTQLSNKPEWIHEDRKPCMSVWGVREKDGIEKWP